MTMVQAQAETISPPVQRLVIFDWSRTLHSPQENRLYPDVLRILTILKDRLGFKIAVRMRCSFPDLTREQVHSSRIKSFVDGIYIVDRHEVTRRESFEHIARLFKVHPEFIVVVDDNQLNLDHPKLHGSYTVHVAREGDKYSDISGDTSPDSTINCIEEILTVGPIERLYRELGAPHDARDT